MIRSTICAVLDRLGYEVRRKQKSDDGVYLSFPESSLSERRFYNIGAGSFEHRYWTNVDYASTHYSEVQKNFVNYNLMDLKPLPIEDNIAEIVYSSHTIEHISDDAANNMLKECYRILKPGGGIRLTAPNAWLEFEAYKRNDNTYWYWSEWNSKSAPLCKASIHQNFLHHFASQLCEIDIDDSPKKKYSDAEIYQHFSNNPDVSALDYFTKQCQFNPQHPGNHMNWWTHEKLVFFLKKAGFSEPYISGWGQSVFPPLRDTILFDSTHPKISLYVEAVK